MANYLNFIAFTTFTLMLMLNFKQNELIITMPIATFLSIIIIVMFLVGDIGIAIT